MGLINQEEIVEVTSNLLGRIHGGIDIEFLVLVILIKILRQHAGLNVRSNRELTGNPLFLGGDILQIRNVLLERIRHMVKRARQLTNLIIGGHIRPSVKITAANLHDILCQLPQRVGNLAGNPSCT